MVLKPIEKLEQAKERLWEGHTTALNGLDRIVAKFASISAFGMGSARNPHWHIQADAAGRWSVTMNLAIDTSRAEGRMEKTAVAAAH